MINSKLLKFLEASDNPDSNIWIVGIPFDGTSSFKSGSRFAPDAIRNASQGIESYSPYMGLDLNELDIYDFGNMDIPFSSAEKTVENIYQFYSKLIGEGKRICTLGGEHSITFPIIKAMINIYRDLKFFHLDAHADMRDEYGGSKYSHASVIRRVLEIINKNNYYGFGIRSGLEESFETLKSFKHFYPFQGIKKLEEIKSWIDDSTPIYISLDLDILDPSCFPGTGAPEPAGITTNELLHFILKLNGFNIVGFDIVELCPQCDPSGISETTAAFFTRELLLMMGKNLIPDRNM